MSGAEHQPLGVVPLSHTPSTEVFRRSYQDQLSELFPPYHMSSSDTVLGSYIGRDPQPGDPLAELADKIREHRSLAYEEEIFVQNGHRTDETAQVLFATMLQLQLINRINNAHKNLLADGWHPIMAVGEIAAYVDRKFLEKQAAYLEARGYQISEQATPERHEDSAEKIKTIEACLEHLEFERLSASAIINFLQDAIVEDSGISYN